MTTRVVHVRHAKFDRYIGRAFAEFASSDYGNPFHLNPYASREDVILEFVVYWYAPEQKWLRDLAVLELTGTTLGCWCKPKLCHGDIIAGYLDWKNQRPQLSWEQEWS